MWRQWPTSYRLGDDSIHSVQHEYRFPTIIQLDEVGPPPPSSNKALLSPVTSSSQSYDYYSSSEDCEEVEEVEDEEEEATESYCSSDLSGPRLVTGDPERASETASAPVEQTVKMSRVLAWRNSFDSVFTESNAGMFCLSPSPLCWYPALPLSCRPSSRQTTTLVLFLTHSHVSGFPLRPHVPSRSSCLFSRNPPSSGVDVAEAEILARDGGG